MVRASEGAHIPCLGVSFHISLCGWNWLGQSCETRSNILRNTKFSVGEVICCHLNNHLEQICTKLSFMKNIISSLPLELNFTSIRAFRVLQRLSYTTATQRGAADV